MDGQDKQDLINHNPVHAVNPCFWSFSFGVYMDGQDKQDLINHNPVHAVNPCFWSFSFGVYMDGQDKQDLINHNPVHPVYPCLDSLLLVKRLYSSLGLPKLMSKPTSIPVAFR